MTDVEYRAVKGVLKHYGAEVRHRREEAGIGQKDLAAKLSISQSVISYIECGCYVPSPQLMRDIDLMLSRLAYDWVQ